MRHHGKANANAPTIVPRPAGAQIHVPPGFSVDEFARGFARQRFMVEGPGGHEFTAFDDALGPAVAWSRPQGA
jgi:hypothetical protein